MSCQNIAIHRPAVKTANFVPYLLAIISMLVNFNIGCKYSLDSAFLALNRHSLQQLALLSRDVVLESDSSPVFWELDLDLRPVDSDLDLDLRTVDLDLDLTHPDLNLIFH